MRQGSSAGSAATLTDEQILEMGSEGGDTTETRAGARLAQREGDDDAAILDGETDVEAGHRTDEGAIGADAATNAEESGDPIAAKAEPEWLTTLDAQPEAAAEARRWHAAANDVAALDAAYFSADAGARAGLATRLYESDPAAFREMLAASARTLAARDPQGLAELARQLGVAAAGASVPEAAKSISRAARPAEMRDGTRDGETRVNDAERVATMQNDGQGAADSAERDGRNGNANHAAAFPTETYRAFEATTNEDVSRQMREAIERSLRSTLPEGVAAGARRRIGEDIFREVHSSLSSDRELAVRVGETLRDWRFDAAARQQIVALVSGRARAVLPEVARRVVTEWTSSVLASDRAKTARIDAAASRRDITGGHVPEPVAGSASRQREVDYQRMSDQQILEM